MGQIFQFLEQLLGQGLAFFFNIVPVYGVAIILLTITVNLVLFPLTLKQTRATRAFQAIQPEVKRIQKELKDSPEEMQKELMRVQREAGATPGGCLLPLVVQFPIWLALFRTLQNPLGEGLSFSPVPSDSALAAAIRAGETTFLGMELGTRPSEAFAQGFLIALPYLVMMAIMVATQYVQQYHATRGQITPAAGGASKQQQQTQQVITRIMPLFIGVISWNFPAGLVLYWTTSNLFRFGQQVVIFKIDGRPQTPALPEPESKAEGEPKPAKPQPGAADKRRRRRRK